MNVEEQKEYNYTINAIDKKLDEDLKRHAKHIRKLVLLLILVLLIVFRTHITYWVKFGFAFHSNADGTPISVMAEPIQNTFTDEEKVKKTFEYKSLLDGNKIKIVPVAYYKIAGLVVATSGLFLSKADSSNNIALYDVGITWGKLGDKDFYKRYFECTKLKNELTGANVLFTSAKVKDLPVTPEYAMSHWSHTHIVPANNNIMGALIRIRTWDKIVLEGMLIDMEYMDSYGRKYSYYTNTVRDEEINSNNRSGNYEIMFVTSVRLGNKVYK